jgi:hypothetical protein
MLHDPEVDRFGPEVAPHKLEERLRVSTASDADGVKDHDRSTKQADGQPGDALLDEEELSPNRADGRNDRRLPSIPAGDEAPSLDNEALSLDNGAPSLGDEAPSLGAAKNGAARAPVYARSP